MRATRQTPCTTRSSFGLPPPRRRRLTCCRARPATPIALSPWPRTSLSTILGTMISTSPCCRPRTAPAKMAAAPPLGAARTREAAPSTPHFSLHLLHRCRPSPSTHIRTPTPTPTHTPVRTTTRPRQLRSCTSARRSTTAGGSEETEETEVTTTSDDDRTTTRQADSFLFSSRVLVCLCRDKQAFFGPSNGLVHPWVCVCVCVCGAICRRALFLVCV
mmetsp:Transcript_42209/g.105404  ORF Transcript_42209/g.105404 Transcript_42209/m.105404 type:complete len:217 (+) Transcript_42209:1091-1741(+)